MNDPYAQPASALENDPDRGDAATICARLSARLARRFLLGALAACALVSAAFYRLGFDEALPAVGVFLLLVFLGLSRFLDRRPRLEIGSRGIRFRPFGWHWIPWSAFSGVGLRVDGPYRSLTLVGLPAETVTSRLSWPRRVQLHLSGARRGDAFYVRTTELDVPLDRIWACIHRYVEETPAPPTDTRVLSTGGAAAPIVFSKAIAFPEECPGCGSAATTQATIRVEGPFASLRSVLAVPCCARCRARRLALGLLFGIAAAGSIVSLVCVVMYAAEHARIHSAWRVPALIACVVGAWPAAVAGRRAADRWIWRMHAVPHGRDQIELRFAEREIAERIAALNASRASTGIR